jgi:hypothetical protein
MRVRRLLGVVSIVLVFGVLSVCLGGSASSSGPETRSAVWTRSAKTGDPNGGISRLMTELLRDNIVATDYSQSAHWLALPSSPDKAVDVFYVYPTSWSKVKDSDPNTCAIDDPAMLKGSKMAFDRQATALETVGNIYAPYYRQMDARYQLALPLAEQIKSIQGEPVTDVTAAFEYYLAHYNNGRPFILAGHSQGSNVLLYLLSDYMKSHPDVYKRMIAAYVIGYPVTGDFLAQNPHLRFAEGPGDTGVIISYNTEAPTIHGTNPIMKGQPGAIAINPITWTRGEELATAQQSLGSLMPDANGNLATVPHHYDARVDKTKGVVICSTGNEEQLSPGTGTLYKGIYHLYDYSFYYYNIRDNAAIRTQNFLNKQ